MFDSDFVMKMNATEWSYLAGSGLVAIGVAAIYWPMGFIVIGGALAAPQVVVLLVTLTRRNDGISDTDH